METCGTEVRERKHGNMDVHCGQIPTVTIEKWLGNVFEGNTLLMY